MDDELRNMLEGRNEIKASILKANNDLQGLENEIAERLVDRKCYEFLSINWVKLYREMRGGR